MDEMFDQYEYDEDNDLNWELEAIAAEIEMNEIEARNNKTMKPTKNQKTATTMNGCRS